MKIALIELTKFRNNSDSVKNYKEGRDKLGKSGLINLLRIFARPFSLDNGANVNSAAYSAAFTEGYNKALDDIIYFEEVYMTDKKVRGRPIVPNFGGIQIALQRGDLTEKEAEELTKNGSRK